jgi:hypothetical protein
MPKPVQSVTPAPPNAALNGEIVDELGACDTVLAPLRSLIAREDALKRQLRTIYAADTTPGEIAVEGARFRCVLGPRGNQTGINLLALVKMIKPAAFARFATTTLEKLRKHVTPDVYLAVTLEAATGPRGLKTYAKAAV